MLCGFLLFLVTQAGLGAVPAVSAADIERIVAGAARFDEGQTNAPLLALEQLVNQTQGHAGLRARLERQLTTLLESSASLAAKQFACRQLWVIGTDASVPALAKLLVDSNPHAAEAACFALSKHPARSVDNVLREALANTSGTALVAVINLVGERRDAHSVRALVPLCQNRDIGIAAAATAALGKIASPDAVKALERIRTAAADHAQLQAAQELAARGKRTDADRLYRQLGEAWMPLPIRRGALIGRINLGGNEALPLVLATLDGKEAALKPAAIACVPALKGASVARALADKLPGLPADLQAMLIEALVDRGDPQIRSVLVKTAGHPDAAVRFAALKGLGTVGDASVVPLLIARVNTDEAAAWSLRVLKAKGTDEAIRANLKSAQGPLRAKLIEILVARGCKSAAAEMLADLSAPDPIVAEAAWRAQGVLGQPSILPALIQKLAAITSDRLRPTAEFSVAQAAGALPVARQADAVCDAMRSASDADVRASLLRVLGRIANDRAFATVAETLKTDPEAAVRVLADWPDARALDPLLEVLKTSTNSLHQFLAFNGCMKLLKAKPSLARYVEVAAFAKRPQEMRLLLSVLAESSDPQALPLVAGYLDYAEVRNEAALAAIAIARKVRGNRKAVTTTMQQILQRVDNEAIRKQAQELAGQPAAGLR